MAIHARGTFEVRITPQPADERPDAAAIGRMLIDKQFLGDLEASSQGQMLAFRSETKGSAGYVAMERVHGSLNGRTGSFVLQHSGSMARGDQHLSVTVVADSGTGELTGLQGTMAIIIITDGKHSYEFGYTLPTH
jgi:hypothetical protein